jgi:CHAT domain-containing protein
MRTATLLAPISPGELIDRLTILQIKSQRITDPAKLQMVQRELDALSAVRNQSLPNNEQLDAMAAELKRINEQLWRTEDDIREADRAGEFGARFVELAKSVYRTNDRRAELKRQINVLLGSAFADVKQYAGSQ